MHISDVLVCFPDQFLLLFTELTLQQGISTVLLYEVQSKKIIYNNIQRAYKANETKLH